MRSDLMPRLLALSEKTGDRIVVVEGDRAFVIVPFEEYERLSGSNGPTSPQRVPVRTASVDDPVAAMNREVAALKDQERNTALATLLDEVAAAETPGEEQFYLEPIE